MRTHSTPLRLTRPGTNTGRASRSARTDAAVIAQYIQDLTRTERVELSSDLAPAA